MLTEVASKRLGAIREFAEFGSGFKIAMRDLEIRGAGNVLGPEQSGFLLSVGYDMYLKLPPSQTAMCPRRSSGWTSTAASPPSAPRRTPTT